MIPNPIPTPAPRRVRLPTVRPRWVYVFLALNVLMFIVLELNGGSTNAMTLIRFGANEASLVSAGQYWRLFTANFLHIGVMHLVVNTYALYALGSEVETLFGHSRFIVIYLLTGISGAIFSFMFTQGLSAGASTSLFGLFGALAVFFYRQRGLLGNYGQQRLVNLGVVLLVNVMIGFSPNSQIDNWGHLGGLIGGAILGWFLCPRYQVVNPFERALTPEVQQLKPELFNGEVMDTNSLSKQMFTVGLFAGGLILLTLVARLAQPV